jgi:hypothetical protein
MEGKVRTLQKGGNASLNVTQPTLRERESERAREQQGKRENKDREGEEKEEKDKEENRASEGSKENAVREAMLPTLRSYGRCP